MARSKSTRNSKKASPAPPPTWDEPIIKQMLLWQVELAGLLLFLFSTLTIFGLINLITTNWLLIWTQYLRQAFGWGTFPLFFSLAAVGVHLMLHRVERPYQVRPKQILGFELALLSLLPLSYQLSGGTLPDAYRGLGGGLFGWALAAPLLDFLGPFLTGLIYLGFLAWGIILLVEYRWESFLAALHELADRLEAWGQEMAPEPRAETAVSPPRPAPRRTAPDPLQELIEPEPEPNVSAPRRSKRLPPFALLDKVSGFTSDPAEIDRKKKIIERTLADFGLPATIPMGEIRQGPAVTQFGIVPGYIQRETADGIKEQKVRVSQIRSIQRDLALALSAPRLRVQSPVPGRGVVGVEVPNDAVDLVTLRSLVVSQPFRKLKSPLAVGLGRDVSGNAVAVDLAKLPHLLIAGTTGSGKSVCINALISCLVFNNTPDKLKLVMIDPKKVELIRFNGLPHMIGNVEVDADRAVGVLRWLTAEMDRRYELFTKTGARNLNGYNHKAGNKKDTPKLPYMAVFIDELADLMHTYPGDVERTLCRLAQMARATGIHLIVATQRPSTDVITGLIKANFPARLSFSVASSTDSRVILDTVGADQLLGKGDMLFLPSDAPAPIRVQGAFVSDNEIEQIVNFWQEALPDAEPMSPPWETLIAKHALLDETDMLLEAAIELAQKQDYLSTSFLQRRLRLGYPRAARLMETLHEMGLVADPKRGGKTRRSLVDENDTPLEDLLDQ